MEQKETTKSNQALREEAILAFWRDRGIFEQSVTKNAGAKEFVFYEGPPTANAKPALHHLEARAFKDVIPRYKTMQGYHVARRAGWDTHGLPVELQIEKKLGLESKKQIEEYGVSKFNKECKESVFTYIKDWEAFTDRIGYWVDKGGAYYTFNAPYMESLWHIVAEVDKKGLLYKDYKVVPWCPRCGTALSSHELAQGYEDDKDLSVYVKFKITNPEKIGLSGDVFILAWTTTPWTLPGNVALAVNLDISYRAFQVSPGTYVLCEPDRAKMIGLEDQSMGYQFTGRNLVGLEYDPLFPEMKTHMQSSELRKEEFTTWQNGWKVYAADFVTTTDGTGVVHIAPMYGADDFDLATKNKLPKLHTVDEAGHFVPGLVPGHLAGKFVKEKDEKGKPLTDVAIIDYLTEKELFFKKEPITHSYPHCWRCKTPLIYYARDSWYFKMDQVRKELIAENEKINWEPEHIREGRFGEWLRGDKDWAISRERYWGTPLPVWLSSEGSKIVVDSVDTLKRYTKRSGNTYHVMRHGQTDHNLRAEWNCDPHTPDPLTELGKEQVLEAAKAFEGGIDLIFISPFKRTKQTAELFASIKGHIDVVEDSRIGEWNVGAEFNNRPFEEYFKVRNSSGAARYQFKTNDGESYADVFSRAASFLYEIEKKYQGKKILIITHGAVARVFSVLSTDLGINTMYEKTRAFVNYENAEIRTLNFTPIPHDEYFDLDLHKPYIDDVVLYKDGVEYRRVKEVMDVWFDSGSMPFAQEHYMGSGELAYPADFISEAIDQTRGWFYTLLAVGVLMGRGTPYKNVICLGHLLDKDGKKMSKSVGNVVEPFEQMDKFGVDAVRWWMYSVNAPGESKNYDEKSVAEINNKVFNLLGNVLSFYEQYRDKTLEGAHKESPHVLDQWIVARLNELIHDSTTALDMYDLFRPTRATRDFIDDLSTWYLRRSRDRLRDGDSDAKRTLYYVLKTTAQLMAPFAPFFAEHVWQTLRTSRASMDGARHDSAESDEESVHLSIWPQTMNNVSDTVVDDMEKVRTLCAEGNALRKKEAIPVRQPLQSFSINTEGLENYYDLIKDELNVKEIKIGEIELDTTITPELKLEGEYRELIRIVQDMRKERGLTPQNVIILTLPETYKEIVDSFGEDLKKTVGAREVVLQGEDVIIG